MDWFTVLGETFAACVMCMIAECSHHCIVEPRSPLKVMDVACQGVVGLGLQPITLSWARLLEHWFGALDPDAVSTLLRRVLVTQTFFAPLINSSYLLALELLQKGRAPDMLDEVRNKMVDVMRASVSFWVPLHFLKQRFVKPESRVLFGRLASVVWMVFLTGRSRGITFAVKLSHRSIRASSSSNVVPGSPRVASPPRSGTEEPTWIGDEAFFESLDSPRGGPSLSILETSVPDHSGDWILTRVSGDFDRFLGDVGVPWLKRRFFAQVKYGVGHVTMKVVQNTEDFEITNVAQSTTVMQFRVDGTDQSSTDMIGRPVVCRARWAEQGVLELESKRSDGEVLPVRRQWREGDELIVALVSLQGTVANRHYTRK
uniref:Uncharacterized protein n=1 Tax=Noctiluca scintillans TaxID=2966 RepID=A0A7S1B037_NOCSC